MISSAFSSSMPIALSILRVSAISPPYPPGPLGVVRRSLPRGAGRCLAPLFAGQHQTVVTGYSPPRAERIICAYSAVCSDAASRRKWACPFLWLTSSRNST